MKNFFKLLNFELNRVMKLLISLMVFTLIVQLIGVFCLALSRMGYALWLFSILVLLAVLFLLGG